MKKYWLIFISIFIMQCAVMVSCGKENTEENVELLNFKAGIETFYENVETTSTSMNGIDVADPAHVDLMLSYLDDMNSYFLELKELTIPEEYSNTSSYITNGYSYMNQANQLYHEGLTMEYPDETILSNAQFAYETAMGMIKELGNAISGL